MFGNNGGEPLWDLQLGPAAAECSTSAAAGAAGRAPTARMAGPTKEEEQRQQTRLHRPAWQEQLLRRQHYSSTAAGDLQTAVEATARPFRCGSDCSSIGLRDGPLEHHYGDSWQQLQWWALLQSSNNSTSTSSNSHHVLQQQQHKLCCFPSTLGPHQLTSPAAPLLLFACSIASVWLCHNGCCWTSRCHI